MSETSKFLKRNLVTDETTPHYIKISKEHEEEQLDEMDFKIQEQEQIIGSDSYETEVKEEEESKMEDLFPRRE